jgi:hypothetical protein
MRHTDLSTDRGNVNNASLSSRLHARQYSFNRIERSPETDRKRLFEILARHCFCRSDADDSSVVDDDINGPQARSTVAATSRIRPASVTSATRATGARPC